MPRVNAVPALTKFSQNNQGHNVGYEFCWVELQNIFFLYFSNPPNLFYWWKTVFLIFFTQNYGLSKYFFRLLSKFKVFWKGNRWAFKMVYINIWFKLTCYEFWSGKLGKHEISDDILKVHYLVKRLILPTITLMWLVYVSRPLKTISRLVAVSTKSIFFSLIIIPGTTNAFFVLASNQHLNLKGFIKSPLAFGQMSTFCKSQLIEQWFICSIRVLQ